MIRSRLYAGALALACALLATPAIAQTPEPAYRPGASVTDRNPQPVKLRCWNPETALYEACTLSGGGGGGGTGDASATNQQTQIARETSIRDQIGALSAPAAGSSNYWLGRIDGRLSAPLTIDTHAVTQSGPWTVNLGTIGAAATAANQTTANGSLATVASAIGAPGAAAPASGAQATGRSADGLARAFATSTSGGLLPGQAAPVTIAPVSISANAATQLDIARTGRLLFSTQLETATTAIAYLCFNGQTNCSATVHDAIIPSGAGVGTTYTSPFGFTGAVYVFSSAAVTLLPSSWIAQ